MTRALFVHGAGKAGVAAWPRQHVLASRYDCLFLRREMDAAADATEILRYLSETDGGHVVAHSEGAVSAMIAAVERPDLVHSLVLFEPAVFSLTQDLPATAAHIALMAPIFAQRGQVDDVEIGQQFLTALTGAEPTGTSADELRRFGRMQLPWVAPLSIVPGVPTLVVTGGWEPLYEEVAQFLVSTGADHRTAPGGHRPQDTDDGAQILTDHLAQVSVSAG